MGTLALVLLFVWGNVVYSPRRSRISASELDYIAAGGAQVDMEDGAEHSSLPVRWTQISQLLRSRMLIGVYVAQYCITTLTYFFLTWFPIYLVKQRGMSILAAGFVATLPAICGFAGGVLGGILSDALLRRGYSLTVARKLPIIVGLLLSTVMIGCNFISADWLVVLVMSLAFFGKGIGALGWAVVADTSPRRMAGLSGALFNTFGNAAAITTPIIIGYIVAATGTFGGALVFVVANAVVAILSYLLIVGPIVRLELDDSGAPGGISCQRV
jgi:MFS transporter, ACS family, glucarate transporter